MRAVVTVQWVLWLAVAGLVHPALGGELPSLLGDQGMVVAGHPEAAEIGLEVLKNGGNAMDAVVATGLALGVAEPYGSGLGGKGAILYFEAASGKVWFIDGMDAAGREFDAEALGALSSGARAEGASGIGVPGLLAALALGHGKWGSLTWRELVLPAADLSERGFCVVPGMRIFFARRLERIRSHEETARIYLPGGEIPEEGTRLPNGDLAGTLRRIAENGPAGFYEGEVAERIVSEVRAGGGRLTLEDFRDYRARLGTPVSVNIGGTMLFAGGPPTTGGATALLSLKALEAHDWHLRAGFLSSGNIDAWARTLRHVYPRIQAAVADVPDALPAWQAMLEPAALKELRAEAGLLSGADGTAKAVALTRTEGLPLLAGDGWTTHFVVADKFGNVASVTQSLSHHFGSGVTAPGTGVVLNNSLKNFSFSEASGVNYGAPGKRPRSTIAPVIVLREGRPAFALGLPGGGRIPTTTLAVLVDHLYFGRSLGEAIAAPRVHLRRDWSSEPVSRLLQVEAAFPKALRRPLEAMGWEVETVTDTEFFGGVTAIEFLPDGTFAGWADFRRTNHAAGF